MLILRDVIAGNIKAENGIDIQARVATVLRTGFGVGGGECT